MVYRIDVADSRAEIVEATGRRPWVKVRQCDDGEWYAQSRTYRDTSVRVTLDAPPDVEPEVSLTWHSNWRHYLDDC